MRMTSKTHLTNYFSLVAVSLGAMLIAIQVRLRITAGKQLGQDYSAQPPVLFIIILAAAAVSSSLLAHWFATRRGHFLAVIVTLGMAASVIAITLPDVSLLQLVYFVAFGVLIAALTLLWPPTPRANGQTTSVFYHLRRLWENRVLLKLWVRYNVRSRYSQTFLGIAWIILLPLSTALIMTFVFSQIIVVHHIGDVPFIAFFLTAITAWNAFSQGVLQGTTSVVGSMGLMTQVYFPREILVVVKMGETMVDFTFTFAAMLVINALVGIWPNINFIFLPIIILIQIALTLGIMLFVSYITVLVRDIPQLIAVGLQLLFYLTPIIYSIQSIPLNLGFIVLVNPVALLIDAYRSIIVYNIPPDPVNLYYPTVMAGVLLYTGYLFFKAKEKRLVDYV